MPLPKTRPRYAFSLLVVGLFAGGCDTANSTSSSRHFAGTRPIRAVCTTGMVADMVRRVGGRWVQVDQIMGEGIDPHLFKVTPDVIARLDAADVIFYSGLHLEGRMAEVFERLALRKPTIALASAIPEDRLLGVGAGVHDPHLWFDVALWSRTSEAVRGFLTSFDPPHRADYDAQAAAYRAELAALDDECRRRLQAVPEAQRVLVTAHDAFHYFGRAYGVTVRAVQGVSTETEAGVREINELVDFLADRKIKAVFIEKSVSERNIRALVEGCRGRGHEVRIGGELYSDSMGRPETPEGTYVGMVRANVETIVRALE